MTFNTYDPDTASTFQYYTPPQRKDLNSTYAFGVSKKNALKLLGFNDNGQLNAWGKAVNIGAPLWGGPLGVAVPALRDTVAKSIASDTVAEQGIADRQQKDLRLGVAGAELLGGAALGLTGAGAPAALPLITKGGIGVAQNIMQDGGFLQGGSHASGKDLAVVDKQTGSDTGVRMEGGELLFSRERTEALKDAVANCDYGKLMKIAHEQIMQPTNKSEYANGSNELGVLVPSQGNMDWYNGRVYRQGRPIAYYNPNNADYIQNEDIDYRNNGIAPFNLNQEVINTINPNRFNLMQESLNARPSAYYNPNNVNAIDNNEIVYENSYSNPFNISRESNALINPNTFNLSAESQNAINQNNFNLAKESQRVITPAAYYNPNNANAIDVSEFQMPTQTPNAPTNDFNLMNASRQAMADNAVTTPQVDRSVAPKISGGGTASTPSTDWMSYLKYTIPIAQTALGATAALTTKLPEYTPPADFLGMIERRKRMANEGLNAQENILLDKEAQDAYRLGVDNIYKASGGNAGAILGNQNALASDLLNFQLKKAAMNNAERKANIGDYENAIAKELELSRDAYGRKYNQAAGTRAAGGNLLGVGLLNAQDAFTADDLKKADSQLDRTNYKQYMDYLKSH